MEASESNDRSSKEINMDTAEKPSDPTTIESKTIDPAPSEPKVSEPDSEPTEADQQQQKVENTTEEAVKKDQLPPSETSENNDIPKDTKQTNVAMDVNVKQISADVDSSLSTIAMTTSEQGGEIKSLQEPDSVDKTSRPASEKSQPKETVAEFAKGDSVKPNVEPITNVPVQSESISESHVEEKEIKECSSEIKEVVDNVEEENAENKVPLQSEDMDTTKEKEVESNPEEQVSQVESVPMVSQVDSEKTETENKLDKAEVKSKPEEAKSESKLDEANLESKPEDTNAESKPEDANAESKPEDANAESKPEEANSVSKSEDANSVQRPDESRTDLPMDTLTEAKDTANSEPVSCDVQAEDAKGKITTLMCDDGALMATSVTSVEDKNDESPAKEPLSFHSSLKHILPKDKQIPSEESSNCSAVVTSNGSNVKLDEEDSLMGPSIDGMNTPKVEDSEDTNTKGEASGTDTPGKKKKKVYRGNDLIKLRQRLSQMTGTDLNEEDFGADKLYEYSWPQGVKGAECYMIQEQVSQYLGVLSFKRKYPDIFRRPLEPAERTFLRDKGIVSEMQCDLGLTAVKVEDIHDLLSKDFPEKYDEYLLVIRERTKKQQQEARKEREEQQKLEKTNPVLLRKKAIKEASEFNRQFLLEKKLERRAYFDLQTHEVHFPKSQFKVLPREATKLGSYPVSVIPGQFQDYYKKYSSDELRYFPINTAMYSPPRHMRNIYADPAMSDDSADEEEKEVKQEDAVTATADESDSSDSSDTSDDDDDDENTAGAADQKDATPAAEDMEEEEEEGDGDEDDGHSICSSSNTRRSSRRRTPSRKQRAAAADDEDAVAPTPPPPSTGGRGRKRQIPQQQHETPTSTRRVKKVKIRLENRGESGNFAEVVKTSTPPCSICNGKEGRKKVSGRKGGDEEEDEEEECVQCSDCKKHGHPSCLGLTEEMIEQINHYDWQCMECKTCVECKDPSFEDKMLFCDHCDRGYHTFCVGVSRIPTGRWECVSCRGEGDYRPPKSGRGRGRGKSQS